MTMASSRPTDRLHRPQLRADFLVRALRQGGDAPAVEVGGEIISARQVADVISQFELAFRQLGIDPTSRVALLVSNRIEVLYLTSAQQLIGCVSTNLHPLGSAQDHAFALESAAIDTLIFDPESFGPRAAELRDRVPTLERFVALGPSAIGVDVSALAGRQQPVPLVAPDLDPDDMSFIGFTGGTTGRPKGVVHTHRSSAAMMQTMMTEWEWPKAPRHLVCTPLSHAGGVFLTPVLFNGGMLVVLPRFDADAVLAAIEQHRITSLMLVPTMIYALLDSAKLRDHDLSSLEIIYYGASAMSPARLAEAIDVFGPVFFQFYGQAEAPQTLTVMRRDEHDRDDPARLASCGRPVRWVDLALLDEDDRRVPRGDPGEICVRAPLVMKGYHDMPEETSEAFRNGWMHTGDVAREDEHGFLTIVDRKKDMIVTGGFNVFPREVEDVISTHPDVSSVAVIGLPDDRWGETVFAVVVPRPGATIDPEELMALVKEHKGSVQAPKSVEFVDELPLTPVGKPDKKALRQRFWTGQERRVH